MELHLTSEQTLVRDSAAKFIAAAGPKVARGFRGQDPSFAPARLRQVGELGWLGILVPSSMNGLGLGLIELALVLEQAGRGLVCEPIGLAAISAAALGLGGAPHPMLEPVMTGAALVVPALEESAYGDDSSAPTAPTAFSSAPAGAMELRFAMWRAMRPVARCRRRRRRRAASLPRSASRMPRAIRLRRVRHRPMQWMCFTTSRSWRCRQ